jgi:hypothetical protein
VVPTMREKKLTEVDYDGRKKNERQKHTEKMKIIECGKTYVSLNNLNQSILIKGLIIILTILT